MATEDELADAYRRGHELADGLKATIKPGDDVPDVLYAWVTDTPAGGLSLVGVTIPALRQGLTPLVFVAEQTARSVEPIARGHGASHGQPVRLVKFSGMETLASWPA